MSRDRIGIAIAEDRLAGVRETHGRVKDPVLDARADGESLGSAIARLLRALVGAQKRLRVSVLVLDPRASAGPLFGVPATSEEAAVRRQLEESPTEFFLGATGSLRAGNVWLDEGAWHGVVVDRQFAGDVQAAIVGAGCQVTGIGTADPTIDLSRGAVIASALRSDGPGVVDVEREARARAAAFQRRGGLAIGAAVLLLWSVVAPTQSLRSELRREDARLRVARAERDSLSAALRATPISAGLLLRAADLEAERWLIPSVLAALVDAMPDSAAIVSLRVDPSQGSATLVARDAAAAVGRLARRSEFGELRIVGAITADNSGAERLERVTVGWNRPVAAPDRGGP